MNRAKALYGDFECRLASRMLNAILNEAWNANLAT